MKESLEKIGVAVRGIRNKRGAKLLEFAHELEVSQSFLSSVENGKSQPSFRMLCNLFQKCNVDISHLLEGEIKEFAEEKRREFSKMGLIRDLIYAIEEYQEATQEYIPPEERAEVFITLYKFYEREEIQVGPRDTGKILLSYLRYAMREQNGQLTLPGLPKLINPEGKK